MIAKSKHRYRATELLHIHTLTDTYGTVHHYIPGLAYRWAAG